MSEDVGEDEEPIKSSSVVHQDDGAVLAPHRLACNHHLHTTQLLHQKHCINLPNPYHLIHHLSPYFWLKENQRNEGYE